MKLVLPYTPGSTTDVVARVLATGAERRWKQPVIVENRPGAGGRVALEVVARAVPDGHTLAVVNTALTTMPYLYKDLGFSPERDLVAVSQLLTNSGAISIPPSIPAKNMQEFATWVKANPGKVNYASPGTGTIVHLLFEMINTSAGIDMVHIPYPGPAQYTQALMRNDVQLIFAQVPQAIPAQKAGQLRIIAVVGDKRIAELPDVQSLKETGWFDYVPTPWQGMVALAGTPKDVIEKIATDARAVLRMPEAMESIRKAAGATVIAGTPAEFTQMLRTEFKLWGEVIKRLGIKPE